MKHFVLIIVALLLALHVNAQQRGAWIGHTAPGRSPQHVLQHEARGSAPANDDCANAQAIIVTADCTSPITANNADATQDGPIVPICDDSGTYLDVWYTFNSGPEDSVAITLAPGAGMTDWAFVLYDACGGTQLYCQVVPSTPVHIEVQTSTDYWLRVYSNLDYGVGGDFTLCVSTPVAGAAPPANDLCTNVTPAPLAVGATVSFTGDNTGATDSEALGTPSTWEAFVLSDCADVKISYCGTTPAWYGFWTLLYDSCPWSVGAGTFVGSYDSTACGDQNFTLCFSDLPAGTYYYPVVQGPSAFGVYTLNVSATTCGTDQAPNDECAGAIPLVAQASCQPTFFTNTCATQSLEAVTCGTFTGTANDDVWYSFTATAADMTIGGAPAGSMDIVLELFSGTCTSLNSIGCADVGGEGVADDLVATGLSVGNTYYFRVYDFSHTYAFEEPGYDLCVVEGLGSGVGVDEEEGADVNGIYPNPSDGVFTIRLKNSSKAMQVEVIDAAGRTVGSTTSNAGNGSMHVDASYLPQGAYVVRCTDGMRTINERLIIQ